ncbi:MAG: UDP-N-acetylmuramoyl-L-alanine--D-glutamate ligase [Bacteroidetes bacterium]|nr:UDP-N-acetylmuramoyl-L-alanine--D-glutamate ligase [Bacteroidota bacterium]
MSSAVNILVLGAGESGMGAAFLARKKGLTCLVSDAKSIGNAEQIQLLEWGAQVEEKGHSLAADLLPDAVVKSPGIPNESPIVQSFLRKGVPVISEIEFAGRYTKAKLTGITGTNGKTTTTHLVHHIYSHAGLNVAMGGNVGTSFARLVAEESKPVDHYVLEVSSFQLDNTPTTRFHTAILLNITPDHLDRYQYNFERYADAKINLLTNQTAEDFYIFCAEDQGALDALKRNQHKLEGQPLSFGIQHQPGLAAWTDSTNMYIKDNHLTLDMLISDLALPGKHNLYNSMAAGIAARVQEIKKEEIREALSDFQNIEHRMEFVLKIKGMDFINDSKATNINAAWYALDCYDGPLIWIVGGVDKGNDYSALRDLVQSKVKAIICLGKDNEKIRSAFHGLVPEWMETQSMEEAVKGAYYLGKAGDTVLLSPACASFDLFDNYEDRGRKFKTAVRNL